MSEIFMCYVDGVRLPKKIHKTLELAEVEAKRLAKMPVNKDRKVFIIADIKVLVGDETPIEIKKSTLVAPVVTIPVVTMVTIKKKRLLVLEK